VIGRQLGRRQRELGVLILRVTLRLRHGDPHGLAAGVIGLPEALLESLHAAQSPHPLTVVKRSPP
jgi:hypothetical protein